MPSILSVLHDFNGSNGSDPRGSLTFSNVGGKAVLYGVTSLGGANNDGTIFSFTIGEENDSGFTTLHSFKNSVKDGSGIQPHHNSMNLIGDKLYGATLYGGSLDNPRNPNSNKTKGNGNLFSIKTDGTKYKVVHSFNGWGNNPTKAKDGARAHSPFIFDGNIAYGMTSGGGSKNDGTIYSFELDNPQKTYKILHSFKRSTGKTPHGQLAFNTDKTKLYGMTREGGPIKDKKNKKGDGVIFSYDIKSNDYDPILNFDRNEHGAVNKHGFLSLYEDNFYGTTSQGGLNDKGTLFSIHEHEHEDEHDYEELYNQLYSFGHNDADGANPYGSLTLVKDKFYGTTQFGGEQGYGTVFELDPSTGTFTTLASLNSSIGMYPEDNLIPNDQGTILYGLAQEGGLNGNGTIFSVSLG